MDVCLPAFVPKFEGSWPAERPTFISSGSEARLMCTCCGTLLMCRTHYYIRRRHVSVMWLVMFRYLVLLHMPAAQCLVWGGGLATPIGSMLPLVSLIVVVG